MTRRDLEFMSSGNESRTLFSHLPKETKVLPSSSAYLQSIVTQIKDRNMPMWLDLVAVTPFKLSLNFNPNLEKYFAFPRPIRGIP